jgi:membrane-bound serine protease (ClpP class)
MHRHIGPAGEGGRLFSRAYPSARKQPPALSLLHSKSTSLTAVPVPILAAWRGRARIRALGYARVFVLALALLSSAWGLMCSAANAQPKTHARGEGRLLAMRLDGVISPITAEALIDGIDRAERDGYRALIVEVDTPGGLETSMRAMIKRMLASRVPILMWVAPSGSRAASAGVFITMAGDVAAMAPGTNIGAATPINLQGAMDSTLARKATNDAAAFARTVADQRGRNRVWAERAVREAVAVSDTEAVNLHVVDFIAVSMEDLLAQSEGRSWRRDGVTHTLAVAGLPVDRVDRDLRSRLLGVLADPNLAYLLMLLGFYGILFELQNPGAVLPGVVGGISLILACLALSTLPVNGAGVALIVLAIAFFLAEIKVASHGVLAVGGVVSLVLGSLILYQGDVVGVSWAVIAGATLATALFFFVIVGAGLRAQRRPVRTGAEALVGQRAQVIERLNPAGRVRLGGELWNAVCDRSVDAGSDVVVTGMDKLTLRVRPFEEATR